MTAHDHPEDDLWIDRALGEKGPGPGAALDAHLSACARCQQRLDEFETLVRMLSATREESAPARVLTALLARQERARSRPKRVLPLNRPVPALAAALAAIVLFGGGFATGRLRAGPGDGSRVRSSAELRAPDRARSALPAPPRLAIEPAIAGAGDLAVAPWARMLPARTDTTASLDSL